MLGLVTWIQLNCVSLLFALLICIIWGWRHVIFNLTCVQSAGLRSVVATLLNSDWGASGGPGADSGVGVGLTNCYRPRTWIRVDPRKCQPLSIFYLAHTGYRLIVCVFQNYPPFNRDCRKREIGGKRVEEELHPEFVHGLFVNERTGHGSR